MADTSPLTPQEQSFIREQEAKGRSRKEAFDFVISKRGQGPVSSQPLVEYGPYGPRVAGAGLYPEGFEAAINDLKGFAARQTLPIAGAVLGGVGGRRVAGAIPSLRGPGALPATGRAFTTALGEATGLFTGIEGTRFVSGQPLDPESAFRTALTTGGLSLLTAGAANALGRGGGVEGAAANAAVGRPGFAKKLPRDAHDVLAREVISAQENMAMSEGRADLVKIINRAQRRGKFIDGSRMLDAATAALPSNPTRESASAARMLTDDLAMIEEAMFKAAAGNRRAPGARGMRIPLTPSQADEILRKGMTEAVADEFNTTPGGSEYTKARSQARNLSARELYSTLGPDAEDAASRAHAAMTAKEKVAEYFPADRFGDPRLSTPGRVASAASGSPSGPTLLKKLQEFDSINKTELASKSIELDQKTQWGPADQRTANYIGRILGLPGSASFGLLRDFIRSIARGAVRAQGMTGAASRAYASQAFTDALRSEREQTP